MNDDEDVRVLQGWLEKKKNSTGKGLFARIANELHLAEWNSRFFVVSVDPNTDKFSFAYLQNEKDKKAKWSCGIEKITDVFIVDDDELIFQVDVAGAMGTGKAFMLRCETDGSFETWVTCLAKFVDDAARSTKKAKAANKLGQSSTNRVKQELTKAKEKAAKVAAMKQGKGAKEADQKTQSLEQATPVKTVDPKAAARAKKRAVAEINKARERALERVRLKKTQEAEEAKLTTVAPKKDDEVTIKKREEELEVARLKAEIRVQLLLLSTYATTACCLRA